MMTDDLGIVFKLMGGTISTMIVFIIPGLLLITNAVYYSE